jgi:hypothetical protein
MEPTQLAQAITQALQLRRHGLDPKALQDWIDSAAHTPPVHTPPPTA